MRDFEQWRAAARPFLSAGVSPNKITWSDWRMPSVFDAQNRAPPAAIGAPPALSRSLLQLLEELSFYRDAGRWELMYRLVWRVLHENRALLENEADPDVQVARQWSKAIHRDVHKMHAFVRFHEVEADDGSQRYVAWFEPAHEILRCTAPFFEKRFPNMRWMIATPDGAGVWNGERLDLIESPARSEVPREDSTHALWRAYYRNICNVARINPKVMQREMPQRYWRHLPEASEIDTLMRDGAVAHQRALHAQASPEDHRIPRAIARSLEQIALPADSPLACRRCDLWRQATQAVLGDGPEHAPIMLTGEQPGDEEDLRGRPFVGPAGRVLDEALKAAGLDRSRLFVTNAVKHFKWEPRGKLRLHKRPHQQEVRACGTWLEREIENVAPQVIVALGSTAIRAVTGLSLKVEDARQQALRHPRGAAVLCTYHPSAILRAEGERRAQLLRALQEDLRRAATMLNPAKPNTEAAN
ncbi:MAG TPA: UdgX family uracil-DNA binding protein [Steroidobacteraceae bacterium]|nr:UdgX family uracil-DNA binding protein [Steroidobacteraceae bacterium]